MIRQARFVGALCALALVLVTLAVAAGSAAAAPGRPSSTPPAPPTGVTAVAGDEQATVSFSAPASDGGRPILRYRVTATPGGESATGSTAPIVIDSLDNGRAYTFRVTALNAVGESAPSAPSAPVTPVSADSLVVTVASGGARGASDSRREYRFSRDWDEDTRAIVAEASGPGGALVTFTVPPIPGRGSYGPVVCSTRAGVVTSPAGFPLGTTLVTCSRTSRRGHGEHISFLVIVRDTTAPALRLPAGITAESTGSAGAIVSYAATAVDLVDGARPVSCLPASGSLFPLGTTTVRCSTSDTRGNLASGSFAVTVVDGTPPVLTVSPDRAAEATGPTGATVSYVAATALDTVSGPAIATCTPASGSLFALGTTLVTCSATDAAGNTGTATFKVKVVDTTAPLVTAPAAATAEATGPAGAAVSYSGASAADIVDGAVAPSCLPASGSVFAVGTTTVTCSAIDAAGNSGSATFSITVVDTTPPVVAPPADRTAEATGPTGAAVAYPDGSAADLVDGALAAACVPAPGSVFALGTTTVTCSATDAHGNAASATFSVQVVDTTAPAVTPPADVTVEATGPSGAAVSYPGASAADAVSGAVPASCVPASGSVFALGTTLVTCSATDAAGNTGSAGFSVRVVDTTAPAVSALAAEALLEATGPAGASAAFTASALDVVDGSDATLCTTAAGVIASPATFPIGTTLVACSATDAAGNTGHATFPVTVVDTTAPAVSGFAVASATHADGSVEATGPSGAAVAFSAASLDIVDGARPVSCAPASGSVFPVGSSTVTCSAADSRGNTGLAAFAVRVVDTTAPNIPPAGPAQDFAVTSPLNAHGDVEATSPAGAVVSFTTPLLRDLVDPAPAVACAPASGSTFPVGATTVSCTATDASGNAATRNYHVTVGDTQAPVVTAPAALTLEATGPLGAASAPAATATAHDVVDGSVPVVCSTPSSFGSLPLVFPFGTTVVSCTATDAHGNTGTAGYTVTVVDTTAPSFTAPASIPSVEATSPAGAAVFWTPPIGSDAVDGVVTVYCSPANGSIFPLGTSMVSCSATDARGNTSSADFSVRVVDTTPPNVMPSSPASDFAVLSALNGDHAVEATSPAGAVAFYRTPAIRDRVDTSSTVTCTPASGSTFPLGTTTVTCTAADFSGNTATYAYSVKVSDTTAPNLLPTPGSAGDFAVTTATHGDGTVEATFAAGAAVSYHTPAIRDIADPGSTVVCSPPSGSVFPIGMTTVSCRATDAFGNAAIYTYSITVVDRTPPNVRPAPGRDFTVLTPDSPGRAGVVEATSPAGAGVSYASPVWGDLVDPSPAVTCMPPSGSFFPVGLTDITCVTRDRFGNEAMYRYTITVVDTTPPNILPAPGSPDDFAILTAPSPGSHFPLVEVEATGPGGASVSYRTPAIRDIADPTSEVTCTPPSGSTFALGTTTVTCTATDRYGNAASYSSYAVRVIDTTGPNLPPAPGSASDFRVTSPLNSRGDVEATSPAGAAVTYRTPGISDIVDLSPTVSCLPASGSTFPLGTSTVTCTATDFTGNSLAYHYSVSVSDTTAPVVTVPTITTPLNAAGRVEATGPSGAVVTYSGGFATDAGSGTLPVTCIPLSGSVFPVGTSRVTCTATDAAGNTGFDSFFVVVVDLTPPVLTVPANMTVAAASAAGTAVTFSASALDTVSGSVATSCTPASGSVFPIGTTTVTCSASDARGNTASASFTVKVYTTPGAPTGLVATAGAGQATLVFSPPASDGGSPVTGYTVLATSSPTGQTVPANSYPFFSTGSVLAAGQKLGVSVSGSWGIGGGYGGSFGGAGATGFATEACALLTSAPMGALLGSLNGGASWFAIGAGPTVVTGPGTLVLAANDCPGPGPGSYFSDNSGSLNVVTYGAVAGGASSPITVGGLANGTATKLYAFATNAAGNGPLSGGSNAVTPATVPGAPTGVTAVAGDGQATVSFTAPAANGGSAITSYAVTSSGGQTASGAASPIVVAGLTNGIAVTFTVRAVNAIGAGAASAPSAAVTPVLVDTVAPVISGFTVTTALNGVGAVEATSRAGAVVTYTVSATDGVDGPVAVSCVPVSGSTFPLGTTMVSCSARDAHGNAVNASYPVSVADTTAPSIIVSPFSILTVVKADGSVQATDATGADVVYRAPTIADLVDPSPSTTCVPPSGSRFAIGTTTVFCSAVDVFGNSASYAYSIRVTS